MLGLLVGCCIGLVLGLTGAGGSVLAVPLLIFVLNMAPDQAVTLSLAAVFGSALFGVITRLRRREIVWFPAFFFAAGGMLFAPLGVYLAQFFSDRWRLASFTVLMLVIAARMLLQSIRSPSSSSVVRAYSGNGEEAGSPMCPLSESRQFEPRFACISMLALAGALTGVLSGIYGVGGGFLIVPVLTMITQLSMRPAVGTSLFVIAVISGTGFVGYLFKNGSNALFGEPVFLWVIAGAIVGMFAGTLLSRKLAGPRLQQIFVAAIVAMAAFTLWNINSVTNS